MKMTEQGSERSKVAMAVPPPVTLIVGLVAAAGLPALAGGYRFSTPHVVAAIVVVALSISLLVSAERSFRLAETPVRPTSPATMVVRTGPYRFSRNPMYVAMIGMVIGVGMLTANHLFIAVAIAVAAILSFGAVRPEERYLMGLFPSEAERYFATVRRWL